jgi:hypothetical protein
MRLQLPELPIFLQAVEDSFGPEDLRAVLLQRFNLKYFNLTADVRSFPVQVMNVHDYFDRRNTTEHLVAALRDARPEVPELARVADSLGFTQLPPTRGLEVLVQHQDTPYQDVGDFRAGLSKRELGVCQVLAGGMTGTGTLIAPDIVITNRHVVAAAMDTNGSLTQPTTCRFDYKATPASGYVTPATDVRAVSVLASSPHAAEDTRLGPMTTSLAALDYALLKLERALDHAPLVTTGDERGFVAPDGAWPAIVDSAVLILQHPGGKPMKIDIGSITDVGSARMRHTVNTEPGSSGAPVFDAGLRMIAIHHAGQNNGPAPGMTYNQAIPLALILADARAKGVMV